MKRFRLKNIWIIIVYLLLLLCLTGCIYEEDQATTTSVISSTNSTGEKVLNLYNIDPYSLDPAIIGDVTSISYVIQIFSGLVRFDNNMEIVPDIAADWDISEDSRVYTFYLRDDVRFHSGRQVRAEDFKYSWERACNPTTGSQTAAIYLGDIAGTSEVMAGEKEDISGVEVVNDNTLRITIKEPKSYFLYKLTYATAFVVNKENVDNGINWWRKPDGSGPFKFKQWDENSLLVLERNEYYNQTSNFQGVDIINFHLWAGRSMDLYETGQIDVAQVGLAYIDKVTDPNGVLYSQLEVFPELSIAYLGFNCQKPPFDDVNIRRAFSIAINKDKLVSLVHRDMMVRADGILPPGMPGYNDYLIGLEYDKELAHELIADSIYDSVSNLPQITITTGGLGGQIPYELEAIVYEWRFNLGIEVEVRQLEPEVFLYELMKEKDEMFYWGWGADYPHPQNFLEILFGGDSEYNIGEYSNLEVDLLLHAASREKDKMESFELYQRAEQIIVSEAACLPLWFGKRYVLIKPYVEGYELNLLGYVNLNKVSVELN
ncbi:MAG: peptide ABC transporter substrate-binding protein [Dehalococcoidia bacterium]|nr:MAG: peptide ABC transporter substrate-binding protein [Dehalococcoidia bacterium]